MSVLSMLIALRQRLPWRIDDQEFVRMAEYLCAVQE